MQTFLFISLNQILQGEGLIWVAFWQKIGQSCSMVEWDMEQMAAQFGGAIVRPETESIFGETIHADREIGRHRQKLLPLNPLA